MVTFAGLRFLDRVPQEELPDYIAAFDLPIIHVKPNPVFRTVVPSKVFEFMAMERPVLMAVEGQAAKVVEEAGCGVCIPSGDATCMAATVKELSRDRWRLAKMGRSGRETAQRRFSRKVHALRVLDALHAAAMRKRPLSTGDRQGPQSRAA